MEKSKVVVAVVVLAIICMLLGLLSSQYFPVFGGIAALGMPWSPARQSIIGSHVLAFGATGAAIGVFIGWVKSKAK